MIYPKLRSYQEKPGLDFVLHTNYTVANTTEQVIVCEAPSDPVKSWGKKADVYYHLHDEKKKIQRGHREINGSLKKSCLQQPKKCMPYNYYLKSTK